MKLWRMWVDMTLYLWKRSPVTTTLSGGFSIYIVSLIVLERAPQDGFVAVLSMVLVGIFLGIVGAYIMFRILDKCDDVIKRMLGIRS